VAKLQREPALLKASVEELLRFDAPINASMIRVATEDTEVAGTPIARGEQVVAFIGAGNRDPEAFDEPNRLWIDRPDPRPHLSFGNGAHFCLGSTLARMQAGIVLHSLLVDRLPELRLKPGQRIEYLEDFPPLRGAAQVLVCPGSVR
jgi:cytochrome P450